jgi:probable addiction module antidote protein
MVKVAPFDTASHLDNPEVIRHYLAEALHSRDKKLILRAIRNVMRAKRIAEIARETGMSRTSLYWKEKTSPEFITVLKVLDAVGVHLEPIARRPSAERRGERRQRPAALAAGRAAPARKPHGARPH